MVVRATWPVVALCCLCADLARGEGPPVHSLTRSAADLTSAEVVVTPARTPSKRADTAAAATVLTKQWLEQTPFADGHQLDDVLRYVPGVQPSNLSSRYNHPTAQAVTLNGLGVRRTLVLLDGMPLNDGFGGWINWGLVPNHIERVEVVPGGTSNLYGTWAMGGVINIITQEPGTGPGFSLDSQAGNLSSYQQAIAVRYGSDRLRLQLGYRWFHTNGFIPVPAYQTGPVDKDNDSRHQLVTGGITYFPNAASKLTLSGTFFREDRNFGTPISQARRIIGNASLAYTGEQGWSDRWEAKVFSQWQTFRNATSQIIPSATVRLSEVPDRTQAIPSTDIGGSVQWMHRFTDHNRVVLGSDVRTIIGKSIDDVFVVPAGLTRVKGHQLGWGLFGEWIVSPTDRLTITPSLRSDWWKNFDAQSEAPNGAITQFRDNVVHVLNPKLAALYQLTDRLRAGASAYQAFRAPTLNELYRGFNFGGLGFLPNSQLNPERLTGGDAKLEGELLADKQLRWRLSGHWDEVKDQILFVTQSPFAVQRQNVGRTRSIGGEIDLSYRPSPLLSLNVGYAYADAVITSFPGNPTREGKRVPFVSRSQVIAGVTLGRPEVLEVTLMGRYLSRQYADDNNLQPIADFVVLDATVQRAITKHVRLFLNGENLTDRQYIATQTGSVKTLGAPLLVMGGIRAEY
jgi:outer membrane receptor protein involved in Fe transport